MKLRNVLIYLVILGALASYVYFVEIKHKQEQQAQEEKAAKIVQLEKDKLTKVELKTPDRTIELQKPGDMWVLSSPIKTAADQFAVGSLIHSALDAKPEKVVLEKDVKWGEYGLDKPEFTVTLTTKDNKKTELLFGAANPAKSSYYARVDDQPKLLLVADTLKNSLNKTPYDLRDKSVLSMAPDDVDRVVVSKGGESIELERQDKDKWVLKKPERLTAKKSLVEAGLNGLTALKAKEIIDEPKTEGNPYGLDNPEETITLGGKKLEQVLLVGKAAGDAKEAAPGGLADLYAKVKGHDTVYVVEARTLKSLKTDPKELRDRSLLTFNPPDIEKIQITLDGKTWLAVQGQDKDKKWTLEKPEKVDKIDTWAITGLLWALKDLEWKSIATPSPDPASAHLANPQLVAEFFQKGEKEPIVMKAGWPVEEPKKKEQVEPQTDNKKAAAEPVMPPDKKTPPTVNVSVQPHGEQNAVFVVDGGFVDRLRSDLERLTEKKK